MKEEQIDTSKNYCSIFKVMQYDRAPILRASEQAEIERLNRDWQKHRRSWEPAHFTPLLPEHPLYRLLKPIEDVWAILDTKRAQFWVGARLLIREMARLKTPYWAWQYKDWEELLRKDSLEFKKFHHISVYPRRLLSTANYLLCDYNSPVGLDTYDVTLLASTIFGKAHVAASIEYIGNELHKWGYSKEPLNGHVPRALSILLLMNRSHQLQDVTIESIKRAYEESDSRVRKYALFRISSVFFKLGFVAYNLQDVFSKKQHVRHLSGLEGVPEEWGKWITKWFETSTLTHMTRRNNYQILKKIGRWLAANLPNETSPLNWTRSTAAAVVAAVDRMKVGDWNSPNGNRYLISRKYILGKPYGPAWKNGVLCAVRIFFRDCHLWEWFPRRFDPAYYLRTPDSVRSCMGPNPRSIADDIWAKLLHAGINLKEEDVPKRALSGKNNSIHYPIEMIRAVTLVWLFAGLRSNEIARLPIGCMRWRKEAIGEDKTNEGVEENLICWLEVPINKTYSSFTKPVDKLVGEAIEAWEKIRPEQQPIVLDKKTNKTIHALFQVRGKTIGQNYINNSLIPILCKKAGVPRVDAEGVTITSHRARSTIATQLFNAKEPLSLFDLQEWLGHREIASTQYYAKLSPNKVAKSYEKAGYFERNIRTIEVLIDQDAVKNGSATTGEPWRYYDLGHGYCTFDFFDTCPHRMACAKCSFYRPKKTSLPQLVEGKENLIQMTQKIPLTEDEQLAVQDGIAAFDKLIEKLAHTPTPAGPTPHEMTTKATTGTKRRPILTKTSPAK